MEYDAAGRTLTIEKAVYENDENTLTLSTVIAKNEYNELGQLKRKTLNPAYTIMQVLEKTRLVIII